jgi:thiol:disulfide interchange protein DsbD
METVKSVLGVALVAAAVAMVLPFLPRPPPLPVSERNVAIMAGLLAFAGVLAGALSLSFHGPGTEKGLKGFALLLLLAGIGVRFGWIGSPKTSPAKIPWLTNEKLAVEQSRATGKPLLIDFGAEWCAACKELDLHTWTDPQVAQEAKEKFVPLKIDATDDNDENEALLKKYGVPGLPTVLMVACKDEPPKPVPQDCSVPQDGPGRVTGFLAPPEMLQHMRQVQ